MRSLEARRWLLIVPPALYALLVFPFVFQDVLGEPDLERMALAWVYGASSGLQADAGYHYNYLVSFGYYQGLYHLLPHAVLVSSSALIGVINYVGFASAVIAVAMLGLYLARLFGASRAFLACVLFAFSPVFLDLGTSGHPQLPGFAVLLSGGWLLSFLDDPGFGVRQRVMVAACSFVIFFVAMTIRADVALAFPFMTLMGRPDASRSEWLRASAGRLLVMGSACVLWLAIVSSGGDHGTAAGQGFVASFFEQFYKLRTVPKGLAMFVLCMGVATLSSLAALLFSHASRQLSRLHLVAIALLALPTLLFWLPNPTPGRHMLLAYVAAAILAALLLSRYVRPPQAVAAVAALVLANQVIAEVAHGPMVRHYDWTYPLLTSRRATDSVPLGAFPLDHAAKQESFALLRVEGRDFARACSGKVLVISEEPYVMMMSLIERDPSVRLSTLHVGASTVYRASGERCTADFVEKQAAQHRDVLSELLRMPQYAGWSVYFQEARRNDFDRTRVPAERRFFVWGQRRAH